MATHQTTTVEAAPVEADKIQRVHQSAPARMTRFSGIIPPKALMRANVAVIGTGAVGRQAALQLAQIGVDEMTLVDLDEVSGENLGPQGWFEDEIGLKKVDALKGMVERVNPSLNLQVHNIAFEPDHIEDADWVFCCVDNMEVRKQVFDAASENMIRLFAEARMGAESCEAHFVYDDASREAWNERWFPQAEAAPETCTTRATSHCSSLAATLLVTGFTKMLRKHPVPQVIRANLQSFHMEFEGMPEGEKEDW